VILIYFKPFWKEYDIGKLQFSFQPPFHHHLLLMMVEIRWNNLKLLALVNTSQLWFASEVKIHLVTDRSLTRDA